jgi:site-specific DNA-methyltransferase (cytosine-N4-specific)
MQQLSLLERHTLEGLAATGNTATTYSYVAQQIGLSKSDMQEKVLRGKDGMRLRWQHKIRSIQQKLKSRGLIENGTAKGEWKLTPKGKSQLTKAPKNSAKAYFTTASGVAFWGDGDEVAKLFRNEIDLIVTSPPYLLGKDREYGNIGINEKEYVENLVMAIEGWLPMLTSTASIVLNIGDSYVSGEGRLSLHKERLLIALEDRLGLHLVQKFQWWSPSKPVNNWWATHARKHCINATEDFLWLSLDPKTAKANNRNVLVDYSDAWKKHIERAQAKSGVERKTRPSGNTYAPSFDKDNGGAIPHNILLVSPESANSDYVKYCKENNFPVHPARYHYSLPEFFVKFLTDAGDVVFDPYHGSGNTGFAAETNDRYWVGSELVCEYVQGNYGRMLPFRPKLMAA